METTDELISELNELFDELANKLVKLVVDNYTSSRNINQAVNDALEKTSFFSTIRDRIIDDVVEAAVSELEDETYDEDVVKDALLNIPWAGNATLTGRLNALDSQLSNDVTDSVTAALLLISYIIDILNKEDKSLKDINDLQIRLKLLLDDYDQGLLDESANSIFKLRTAIKLGRGYEEANNNLSNILVGILVAGLTARVMFAVGKTFKYKCMRVGTTDIRRAAFEGFYKRTSVQPDTFGYQWVLSGSHPEYDVCDVNANANVGYGKGIYPKKRLPRYPAHPHCKCILRVVKMHQVVDNSVKFDDDGPKRYIDKQSVLNKQILLGNKGLSNYNETGNWEHNLRGWEGFETPTIRF